MVMDSRRASVLRGTILAASVLLLVAAGAWFLSRDRVGSALVSLTLAAIGIASVFVSRAGRTGGVGQRQSEGAVLVDDSPQAAFRRATDALQELASGQEVAIDPAEMTASADVARTWKSFGEHVFLSVRQVAGGTHVNVRSACLRRQLVDYGKNRENVRFVLGSVSTEERTVD
jgi:hypothetical protein